MGDPKGFMKFGRMGPTRRPVADRVQDWREFYRPLPEETLCTQGARCMDCGVPFCQGDTGCPVLNIIPDWNDLVHRGRFQDALKSLHATNNFPEFTGRLCPAPCESACVLGIIDQPVSIRNIEQFIIDKGFDNGWVTPVMPARETGRHVAIVGSGPAGLAAAQQLRRSGHRVTVFEKADRVGGLLRYGIPEFKMEKAVLDRRLKQMEAEGVVFKPNIEIGKTHTLDTLQSAFDAVCLAIGAMAGRDLPIPGRDLNGIYFAMDYLTQQNKILAGDVFPSSEIITAAQKRVVIIGGGDTGSDCLGTCHRQGAKQVSQFELLGKPPNERAKETPWPHWPMQLRTSHAHEEGGAREWGILTKRFVGASKKVVSLDTVRVERVAQPDGSVRFEEIPGSEETVAADMVLLALGFTGPEQNSLLHGVATDSRGNVAVDANYMTNLDGVFAAGDAKRGASLIVWAIREGRDAAAGIERYLAQKPTASSRLEA